VSIPPFSEVRFSQPFVKNWDTIPTKANNSPTLKSNRPVGKKGLEPGRPFFIRKLSQPSEQSVIPTREVTEDVVVKHEGLRSSGSCGPGTNPCSTYTLFLAEVLLGLECMLRHRLYRSLTCLRIAATHASRVYGQVTAGMRLTSST
jgi:hypothetical protein